MADLDIEDIKKKKVNISIENLIMLGAGIFSLVGMWYALQGEIEEAKLLPEPEVSRTEYDLKDQLVRETIISTQKKVEEIDETVKKIDDKARYDDAAQTKTLIVMQILGNTKTFFDSQSYMQDTNVDDYLNKTIEDQYGITALSIDYDIVTIDDDMSSGDLMRMVGQKYGFTSPTLYVSKMAGTPVPGNTKKVGESCISNIDKIISYLDLIKNNFEHNVSEYEKIQSDPDLVRRSKGLYNQSSNKSKESVEKSLKTILVAMSVAVLIRLH